MARIRPPERFAQLLEAGLRVFSERGPAATRMADVAAAMGVSPGSLYNYVSGKEALFHWVVEHCADEGPVEAPERLPIPSPADGATLARLRERMRAAVHVPALDAALKRRRVRDPAAELDAVVEELFDLRWRTRRFVRLASRATPELPERFQGYARGLRRELHAKLAWYLERRIARGHLRGDADPVLAAHLLLDATARFAEDPPGETTRDALREALVSLLARGLLLEPAQR